MPNSGKLFGWSVCTLRFPNWPCAFLCMCFWCCDVIYHEALRWSQANAGATLLVLPELCAKLKPLFFIIYLPSVFCGSNNNKQSNAELPAFSWKKIFFMGAGMWSTRHCESNGISLLWSGYKGIASSCHSHSSSSCFATQFCISLSQIHLAIFLKGQAAAMSNYPEEAWVVRNQGFPVTLMGMEISCQKHLDWVISEAEPPPLSKLSGTWSPGRQSGYHLMKAPVPAPTPWNCLRILFFPREFCAIINTFFVLSN